MDIMDMLRSSGGIDALANQLGVPPATATAGAEALLPAILGGFSKRSEAAGGGEAGLGGLIGMLGGLGGSGLADNVLADEPTDISRGNDVLGQIFGSKDVSRSVAGHAAGQAGIDPELLKKMLPILAMLVGGYLSSRGGGNSQSAPAGGGGLGSILGSVLGSLTGGGQPQTQPQSGGLASILDFNRDGNPLDDIIGMAGKFAR